MVTNGQIADQDTFNEAFLSRTQDSDTVAIVGLLNPSAGGLITDLQSEVNDKIAKSTLTAKGSIFVASGSGVVVERIAGTDGFILSCSSGSADGVSWIANYPVQLYAGSNYTPCTTLTMGAGASEVFMTFDHTLVTSAWVDYEGYYLTNTNEVRQTGQILCNYTTASGWTIAEGATVGGDVSGTQLLAFDIDATTGALQYTRTTPSGTLTTRTLKYRARVF